MIAEVGSLTRRSGRSGPGRWLKPAVTIALYLLVFYWIDARKILAILTSAHFSLVGVCVVLYMAGQAISALKWRILLAPVGSSRLFYPRGEEAAARSAGAAGTAYILSTLSGCRMEEVAAASGGTVW